MHPDERIDKVIKMFWHIFPDRKEASRLLAAMSLLAQKIGPDATIDLAKRLATVVGTNTSSSVLSFEREGFAACVVAPAPEERNEIALLEHLMDHLVSELRDRKRVAVSLSLPTKQ